VFVSYFIVNSAPSFVLSPPVVSRPLPPWGCCLVRSMVPPRTSPLTFPKFNPSTRRRLGRKRRPEPIPLFLYAVFLGVPHLCSELVFIHGLFVFSPFLESSSHLFGLTFSSVAPFFERVSIVSLFFPLFFLDQLHRCLTNTPVSKYSPTICQSHRCPPKQQKPQSPNTFPTPS